MTASATYARTTRLAVALGVCLCSSLVFIPFARAQAVPAAQSLASHPTDIHITPVMGLNLALNYAAQHNSATGWANIVSPNLSYRFNRYLSVDASVPWYATVNANVATTKAGVTTYPLKSARDLLGDVSLAAPIQSQSGKLSYMLTPTVALPTGNYRYGLSANTLTYNVTAHAERSFGVFTPDVEAGFGDSSSLAKASVHKAYTAVGSIANFQLGTAIDLPFNLGLDLEAYEDLPIGTQNIYGTITKKHKRGKTVTTQVLDGTGVAEDNGFNTELDLPISHHLMLVGSYERSLIQGLDTASIGVIYTLRSPKIPVLR